MGEVVWERDRKCVCVMTMAVDATVVERHRVDACPVHGVLGAVPKQVLDDALAAAMRVASGIPELQGIAPERLSPILWAAAPYVKEWVAATMTAIPDDGGGGMSYPNGVSLAVITAGTVSDFFGGDSGLTATATPVLKGTPYLVHAATGSVLVPTPVNFSAGAGESLAISVPHTDQDGWLDAAGNPFKGWAYAVKVTAGKGYTWSKTVSPVIGQDLIDLDLVKSSGVGTPIIGEVPTVMSVVGKTGAITAQDLIDAGLGGGASAWDEIADKPETFPTAPPAWDQVTGKPAAFPASWESLTGKPATFPSAPTAWADVTSKPASFPASWSDVTGKPTIFPAKPPAWDEVTGKPSSFPGPATTISIGTVQSGTAAAASMSGAAPAQTLNLTLPRGSDGLPGTPGPGGAFELAETADLGLFEVVDRPAGQDIADRDITAGVADVTAGKIYISRFGPLVTLQFDGVLMSHDGSAFKQLLGLVPVGFRVSRNSDFRSAGRTTAEHADTVRVDITGNVVVYKYTTPVTVRGVWVWRTNQPFPTTFPGTAA